MRFAIADEAYEQLWEKDRTPLLEGLGDYLLLVNTFVRALTAEGIIVELWSYKTSELASLELYEWEFLLCRLPEGEPAFKKLPERSVAETWPDTRPLAVDEVRNLTNMFLLVLAHAPASLYNGELQSARFVLDDTRTELIKIMYRRLGVVYAKRYKHFSEVLPPDWIADLDRTYMRNGTG
ncbi:MAG: hypothetical protein M3380_11625, partial [Chloroflexota bacterium]|nr:hypothetical protein [Chloroflexota bacterium]